MHDVSVPLSRLATIMAWTTTLCAIFAAWTAFLAGHDPLAHMLGYTACVLSAVAATLNIRCFLTRLARLVRIAGRLGPDVPPRTSELRSIID